MDSAEQQQQSSSSTPSTTVVAESAPDAIPPSAASPQSADASTSQSGQPVCSVCGEENGKMHYGVLACLGCKGFFRRALKKVNEYECLRDNNCTIDKQERNSCRSCRLQKCLDVGMDPAAVRPDRDFTGKQQLSRRLSLSKGRKGHSSSGGGGGCGPSAGGSGGERRHGRNMDEGEEGGKSWTQRLPVEMRTMLMTLQNIEAKVVHGDTAKDAAEIYPLRINTIREIIEEPAKLRGRRTEMRYEPYRMAKNEELSVIVYRRLIAAIDWVEMLAERLGGLSTEDRIALVKSCFGPLTLFKCSARTAVVTRNEDMLCLCNFAYVPREISKAYNDAYHLDNGLVERLLNELVSPFRRIHLAEEEIVVCVSAIIVLNPMAKDLSEDAAEKVFLFRNRIYTTLYQIIKECRVDCNTNATFGNLLLYLPIISSLANAMSENLRFAQTFSALGGIPLLTSLFGCFLVEPFVDSEMALIGGGKTATKSPLKIEEGKEKDGKKKKKRKKKRQQSDAGTQTDWKAQQQQLLTRKRRLGPVASLEESNNEFRLLKAPCSYTLTEMFDDRINDGGGEEQQQMAMESSGDGGGGGDQMARQPANRLSRTTSDQQMQHSGIGFAPHDVTEFRKPSGSWTAAQRRQQSHVQTSTAISDGQRQQQQHCHQQQQQWNAAYPPTTQIQGLFLNDESSVPMARPSDRPIQPHHSLAHPQYCWPQYSQSGQPLPPPSTSSQIPPPFMAHLTNVHQFPLANFPRPPPPSSLPRPIGMPSAQYQSPPHHHPYHLNHQQQQ